MANLFEKVKINNLVLKNRFILAAAYKLNDKVESFENFAKGKVALLITGGVQLKKIKSFEEIVKKVHEKDGKIALQLISSIGGRFGFDKGASDAVAVCNLSENSPFFNPFVKYAKHHEATDEEIQLIINEYAEGASLAKSIGADAIEIHSAHQSFLLQFLSPITNRRKDKWGGSLENRTRIHKLIYDAIRLKVGKNYPILIKVGVEDSIDGGLKFSEGKEIAFLLASYGYDALEISQGLQNLQKVFEKNDWTGTPMKVNLNTLEKEAYFSSWCQEIKKNLKIPIIMTGGIKSYEVVKKALEEKKADLFGLCRSLIREPDLISRWENGDLKSGRCIFCNKCFSKLYVKGNPLECFLDLEGKE